MLFDWVKQIADLFLMGTRNNYDFYTWSAFDFVLFCCSYVVRETLWNINSVYFVFNQTAFWAILWWC